MGKLFFPLFLLLVLVVSAVTFFSITQLPAFLFIETDNDYDERSTRGIFILIEQELRQHPVSKWPEIINQLAEHFAYSLSTTTVDDPIFDEDNRDAFTHYQLVKKVIDGAGICFRRIHNSDTVIVLPFSDSDMEEGHRDTQGAYYLIQKQLNSLPIEQWPDKLQSLSQLFGFPIQRLPLASFNLTSTQSKWLRSGKILAMDDDSENERYIKLIANSNDVLSAGPLRIPHNQGLFLLGIALLVLSVFALALLFWAYPFWRDIRALTTLTAGFGSGKMDVRSQLPRRSALYDFSQQFNAMAERIQQLINGHRELTNAVSHELRTPIARIRFGLEMLEQHTVPGNNQYMTGLHKDIDELEELIGELLTYARFERNAPIGKLEPVMLVPWLIELLRQAQAYAGTKVLQLNTEQCPDQQVLNCCPREIARVLHNLLRNACHFATQTIHLSIVVDDAITILIEDDGPGIPVDDRERIFEPFTRLESSRNRSTGGYGLGLAIAQRIIIAHHGDITVQDSALGGACLRIHFSTQPDSSLPNV